MYDFHGKIDLDGFGLDHSPMATAGLVEVEAATLRDNTGLVDRLCRAVAKKWNLDEVTAPLDAAAGLNSRFIDRDDGMWVAVEQEGRKGRIITATDPPGTGGAYGLAVDVGSTTLVLALVDLESHSVTDQLTLSNPQVEYGADILTRAHFAEQAGGLDKLTGGLRGAINEGLDNLCQRRGLMPSQVAACAMAGNTCMTHFVLGLPVRTLIREPYVPVINRLNGLKAKDIGLETAPEAPLLIMPNKGSYFGGDLTAGLVAAGLNRADKTCMMVDVGTNAEVVLGQKDWLIGAAGAAGPALEGGVAARGMVAGAGAIDQVRIDRRTKEAAWRTIDGSLPRGICGSGLIDLFAELFLSGLIDFQGKLTLPDGSPQKVYTDEGAAFVVVPGEETESGSPILLSEVELDILTRSKAGMYTILNTVIKSVGLTFDDLDKFYVAGTFGQYIDPRMAVAVGMIPDIPLEKIQPLGNSSLKGVILTLLSSEARKEAVSIWKKLTYLEMNVNQELMNRFSAARFIPHTDRSRFPSVGSTIT